MSYTVTETNSFLVNEENVARVEIGLPLVVNIASSNGIFKLCRISYAHNDVLHQLALLFLVISSG